MATQDYYTIKNAALITPTTATDLGSVSQPYGNLYLQGNVTLGTTTITATSAIVPKITSVGYPGVATAANPTGGETITVNGTGFLSGISAYVANTVLGATNLVSSTQVTFTAPAQSAGSYTLSVINTDGGSASYVAGLTYSALPVWSTSAGSLGSSVTGSAISTINLSASENAQSITYVVTSGTLPTGLSLSSNGAITGTPSGSATTYNFTVTATDPQGQTATRNFSYTVSIPPTVTASYVSIAGGGSGGMDNNYGGSGGGAGGLLSGSASFTQGTAYTITIGAGASAGPGAQGSNTTISGSGFTTITSIGGGAGAGYNSGSQTNSGGNGGSGGGKAGYGGASTYGRGVYPGSSYLSQARQGYDGGSSGIGGGGGSGDTTTSGTGGPGSSISAITTAGLGTGGYIAGGGGAGGQYSSSQGGSGGGGRGGDASGGYGPTSLGTSGTVNTGSGGGGGCAVNAASGGGGGSGVVLIYYADSNSAASATTGSPTITVTGGYRYYAFKSSGSITF